ncbi:FbpB family small basic protein [Virgibacillus sp. YIM 98842]|nr:FbpB family small basic protein [Virgibacillus sp. YIM 98842]
MLGQNRNIEELIEQNKQALLEDKEALNEIERKLEEKHTREM